MAPAVRSAAPEQTGGTALVAGTTRGLRSRWLPLAVTLATASAILLVADVAPLDLARYAAYAVLTVMLPGTLVYRALRATPHTLVEDVAIGSAIGLALELAAWAIFSAAGLRPVIWLWPLLVLVPFAAVPRLRRHWLVRGYTPVPLGWSWALAGIVVFFTCYLYGVFFAENPILPTSDQTRQFVDVAYQLSLAGEAKHSFPPGLPQVAGEPLDYHWFAYVHLAMTSMVGHLDLPVVTMRLMTPAFGALIGTLTAVAGWRISGRRYAGIVAAALFLVIGEFNFTDPISVPFGTQVQWIVWPSLSMTYSWALLVAVIAVIGDILRRPGDHPVPAIGRGAYAVAALLVFASSAAKASSLPVVLAALALTGVAGLHATRRVPWKVVALGAIVGLAQVFVTAVIFRFHTYGLKLGPLSNIARFWTPPPGGRPPVEQVLVVAGVVVGYLLNLQLRLAGAIPLLRRFRGRTEPVQWFLLGGAIAGPALFLTFGGFNAGWFGRAGFPFGLLLSAWGFVLVLERAKLSRRAAAGIGAGAVLLAVTLTLVSLRFAVRPKPAGAFGPVMPILGWASGLAVLGSLLALLWRSLPGAAGRGSAALLTGILVAGAPGLIMDAKRNLDVPNGGGYGTLALPRSRTEAARWVRDHSAPTDILATNVHCRPGHPDRPCDAISFWLSGYAERSVLVEGWGYAPRIAGTDRPPFWDPALLALNDRAIADPTAGRVATLHDHYRVRFLVVDRAVFREGPALATLATLRYDNGRVAVYEL